MTREEIHKLPWKAQEYINELERKLTLTDVINRRELLNDFVDKYNDRVLSEKRICNDEVDIYLESK